MAISKPADALTQHWTDRLPAAWNQFGPPAPSPAVVEGKPHLGWRSRGYLPHCDAAGLIQHIVFGLADALPKGVKALSVTQGERMLDAGHGECVLRRSDCAAIVEEGLLRADGYQYRLAAWCIMPNHVHVIAQQIEGYRLGDIVHGWKSTAAHLINPILRRNGRLWRREYFDRFMRDDDHLNASIHYVEQNPVKAKLVAEAHDWRWSSAWRRHTAGEGAGGPRAPAP